ncbi:mismatch-specific DNA-glycosylase [Spelaeicoccus albus]|uniref:TDG/mug DNA glycosylase family protein n=1 Tax=Spelaeicoccus albus TaxID=1280376 RepID=A0A7Z0IHX4_9MICO|nr:mismatch-specific DNA-glycosylase [Spelaeicoccus albus]NYI68058.1 TDG/mug DNA glycosylase family protein [Spelaeicoccus albus]
MGFSRAELEAFRGQAVPDLLPEPLELLFVGINPGLWSAATKTHFAKRGNRFYPALYRAGITGTLIDAADGYKPGDREQLERRGIGISNICPIATARADELSRDDLRRGAKSLSDLVTARRPAVVAILGVTAYRTAFDSPKAATGKQSSPWPESQLYVVPNPSGLNAHATLASLAADYREVAIAAGIRLTPPSGGERS